MRMENIINRLMEEREAAQNETINVNASSIEQTKKDRLCEYWQGKANGITTALHLLQGIIK